MTDLLRSTGRWSVEFGRCQRPGVTLNCKITLATRRLRRAAVGDPKQQICYQALAPLRSE